MKKKSFLILVIVLVLFIGMLRNIRLELTTAQVKTILNHLFLVEEEQDWSDTLLRMSNVIFALEPEEKSVPVVPTPMPVVANAPMPSLRNQTSFDIDVTALLHQPLSFLPVQKGKPQVLIVHTHTSEGYAPEERSSDPKKNVIEIGRVIASYLEQQGVEVIHDQTVHDTDYNGSYSRSCETVKKQLEQYPSLQIVLDVHRDAATLEDGQSLRVTSEVGGEQTGQIMLVAGTEEGGLEHPGWETNLSFALRLQQEMDRSFPGLSRPLNVRKERFNQHLASGMLIVEVAASGNSMEEAKRGASCFAKALVTVLK